MDSKADRASLTVFWYTLARASGAFDIFTAVNSSIIQSFLSPLTQIATMGRDAKGKQSHSLIA
jgi:hypothetical protein